MDDIDRAQAQDEYWRTLAIAAQQRRNHQIIPTVKYCLNCGEQLPTALPDKPVPRWCDADCCDDWTKRQRP